MDPNSNLAEQLRIARDILHAFDRELPWDDAEVTRLAELVEALDGWLSKGGFLPEAWSTNR